ncbi:MAG: hypothetical protein LRZ92_01110 [Methanosarcinaceae archaeon]|nr:hypothetical protein [Methanosarcinaceae archaeon]
MDFIKKLFGKKNKNQIKPTIISLNIEQVADWVEVESEKIFIKIHPFIKRKYEEIDEILKEINENKLLLNDAEFNEQLPKRSKKAAISNRNNFIKNLSFALDKIELPDNNNPITAYEFYKNAKSIISASIEHSLRSQQYVKAFYPKEYDAIVMNLSEFNKSLEELHDIIEENKDIIKIQEKTFYLIENLMKIRKLEDNKKKSLLNFESKIVELNKEVKFKNNRLADLKSSKDFELYNKYEKEKKSIKNELKVIDFDIKQLFAPISKVLMRIKKQDESGRYALSDEKRKILNILIETPELISGININPLLKEIKGEIEKGTFGLKQPKLNKTIEYIDRLISNDRDTITEKRNGVFKNYLSLSDRMNNLTIYKDIEKEEKEVRLLESSIESIKHHINLENEQLLNLKNDEILNDLSDSLSNAFGKVVKVCE